MFGAVCRERPGAAVDGRAGQGERVASAAGRQLLDGAVTGDVALAVAGLGLLGDRVRVGGAARNRHERSEGAPAASRRASPHAPAWVAARPSRWTAGSL